MTSTTKTCKLGARDCMVLQGTRADEICPSCKMVVQGTSLESGNELKLPLHFVARPKASVTHLPRKH